MRLAFAFVLGALAATPAVLSACGSDDAPFPPPDEQPATAPATNDPAFQYDTIRRYYLVGDDLTPGHDTLSLRVLPPAGTDFIDAWIDGGAGVRLTFADLLFHLDADIGDLAPGDHEVILAANGADTGFARLTFKRSHPLYFQVTTDWDFSDPSPETLEWQDALNDRHPAVQITNFVGPYSFTDAAVTDARELQIVDWLAQQRDDHGDEIALHIHPYCNFVEYAGLPCNIDDSFRYATDASGYTVELAAYGDADFRTLLEAADQLFMERGLGKPTTFRAGGWTASIETLRALEATGYVADTSANNWARMEEWNRPMSGTLYAWNMEHWAPINDTSQPYYPSDDDILLADAPTLGILEVPDNAIMVDYVTVEEMVEIFHANWPADTALLEPVSFMMGYHPSEYFSVEEQGRIDGILDHADQFLAENGDGPVVYALLRDMPMVWKPAE